MKKPGNEAIIQWRQDRTDQQQMAISIHFLRSIVLLFILLKNRRLIEKFKTLSGSSALIIFFYIIPFIARLKLMHQSFKMGKTLLLHISYAITSRPVIHSRTLPTHGLVGHWAFA